MDPNQQPGQQPPQPQTPPPTQAFPAPAGQNNAAGQYDFINNPLKPGKRKAFGGGSDRAGKLKIFLVGFGVFTLLLLIGSLISGGPNDKDAAVPIMQAQSVLISTADAGADKAGSNNAKSFALSVKLSLMAQQNAMVIQVKKNNKKLKSKEYSKKISTKTATEFQTAERNGQFDQIAINEIKDQLRQYQLTLQAANGKIKSNTLKQMIANDYKDTGLLLETPTVIQ